MRKNIYTAKEIEKIQLNMIALLYYVKIHDKLNLPMCFQFCERIVKNIDICRDNKYENISELSMLIRSDWNSVMEPHVGLSNYYIPNSIFQIQKAMNTTIAEQILVLGRLIDG